MKYFEGRSQIQWDELEGGEDNGEKEEWRGHLSIALNNLGVDGVPFVEMRKAGREGLWVRQERGEMEFERKDS